LSKFASSKDTGKNIRDKVLIYGPTHTSKTHAALGWPDPAIIDVENRAGHFADRFQFMHARPRTMQDIVGVLDELQDGQIGCASFIIDGYSAIYEKLVVSHTDTFEKQGKMNAVTDYAMVNKRIAPVREFIFAAADRNLIVTAHSQQKYDRTGNNFSKRERIEFLGDDKFRYAFDYIFRTEATGPDPRANAIKFHVEKSASPRLKIGDTIVVRPNEAFYVLFQQRVSGVTASGNTHPRESGAADTPGRVTTPSSPVLSDNGSITTEQRDRLEVLMHQVGIAQSEFVTLTKNISARRTPLYQELTAREAATMIANLEKRLNERNAA